MRLCMAKALRGLCSEKVRLQRSAIEAIDVVICRVDNDPEGQEGSKASLIKRLPAITKRLLQLACRFDVTGDMTAPGTPDENSQSVAEVEDVAEAGPAGEATSSTTLGYAQVHSSSNAGQQGLQEEGPVAATNSASPAVYTNTDGASSLSASITSPAAACSNHREAQQVAYLACRLLGSFMAGHKVLMMPLCLGLGESVDTKALHCMTEKAATLWQRLQAAQATCVQLQLQHVAAEAAAAAAAAGMGAAADEDGTAAGLPAEAADEAAGGEHAHAHAEDADVHAAAYAHAEEIDAAQVAAAAAIDPMQSLKALLLQELQLFRLRRHFITCAVAAASTADARLEYCIHKPGSTKLSTIEILLIGQLQRDVLLPACKAALAGELTFSTIDAADLSAALQHVQYFATVAIGDVDAWMPWGVHRFIAASVPQLVELPDGNVVCGPLTPLVYVSHTLQLLSLQWAMKGGPDAFMQHACGCSRCRMGELDAQSAWIYEKEYRSMCAMLSQHERLFPRDPDASIPKSSMGAMASSAESAGPLALSALAKARWAVHAAHLKRDQVLWDEHSNASKTHLLHVTWHPSMQPLLHGRIARWVMRMLWDDSKEACRTHFSMLLITLTSACLAPKADRDFPWWNRVSAVSRGGCSFGASPSRGVSDIGDSSLGAGTVHSGSSSDSGCSGHGSGSGQSSGGDHGGGASAQRHAAACSSSGSVSGSSGFSGKRKISSNGHSPPDNSPMQVGVRSIRTGSSRCGSGSSSGMGGVRRCNSVDSMLDSSSDSNERVNPDAQDADAEAQSPYAQGMCSTHSSSCPCVTAPATWADAWEHAEVATTAAQYNGVPLLASLLVRGLQGACEDGGVGRHMEQMRHVLRLLGWRMGQMEVPLTPVLHKLADEAHAYYLMY